MRILMIAAPGAGKGTQGALIATHFTIPHIATGDLLRQQAGGRLGTSQNLFWPDVNAHLGQTLDKLFGSLAGVVRNEQKCTAGRG